MVCLQFLSGKISILNLLIEIDTFAPISSAPIQQKTWRIPLSFVHLHCASQVSVDQRGMEVNVNNKGLVIFNPAVGGWSRAEGVKNFRGLLEGGLKNHKFFLRGLKNFLVA